MTRKVRYDRRYWSLSSPSATPSAKTGPLRSSGCSQSFCVLEVPRRDVPVGDLAELKDVQHALGVEPELQAGVDDQRGTHG